MIKMDPKLAQRVWQRVQGEADLREAPQFLTLIYREQALENDCRRLAAALPRKAAPLKKIADAASARAVCLRGMGYLDQGSRIKTSLPAKKTEPTESVLRRCCGQCANAIAEYDRRSDEMQYGCVFSQMAQEHRAHYRYFLELLG